MLLKLFLSAAATGLAVLSSAATTGSTMQIPSQEEIDIACESPNHPNDLRPQWLGIFYSQTEYRGENITFGFEDKNRCINLDDPLHVNCKGSERTYGKNKGNVKAHRGILSIRCKQWHNPSSGDN
ncbi:hypothetical protein CP532_1195 [Ophiocordyceps camponoti-leonardi (nom. inval.)]|nr:hypothetical protein CP532_1195 [Ophiocordyceps camponoti-leonardi (nom. inval.)]